MNLTEHYLKIHSQRGEEGPILAALSQIRFRSRFAVEFGAGDGWTNSNTRLLKQFGWDVLMLDAEPRGDDVHLAKITVENINEILDSFNVPVDFDLLSIDIDGNDLWVWREISRRPRLVVIEFNACFDQTVSTSIPYDPAHMWDGSDYYGASLEALRRTSAMKGYTLIYQHASLNAFFLRNDLVTGSVGPVSYEKLRDVQDPHHRAWVEIP